jgi:hypothetical protein
VLLLRLKRTRETVGRRERRARRKRRLRQKINIAFSIQPRTKNSDPFRFPECRLLLRLLRKRPSRS